MDNRRPAKNCESVNGPYLFLCFGPALQEDNAIGPRKRLLDFFALWRRPFEHLSFEDLACLEQGSARVCTENNEQEFSVNPGASTDLAVTSIGDHTECVSLSLFAFSIVR